MSSSSFGGLWTYPSTAYPGHNDFMLIDEERPRIITFIASPDNPHKFDAIQHWYETASATSIYLGLKPNAERQVHEFKLDGELLTWTYGGKLHTWLRVASEQRPDWLNARLATAYSKMDATEHLSGGNGG